YLSPMAWLGLILLVSSISRPAGGVVLLAFATVTVAFLAVAFVRGIWRFPTAVRLVGDPDAWRGNRLPYWEKREGETDGWRRGREVYAVHPRSLRICPRYTRAD